MSKTSEENHWIPSVPDTLENVAKAILNPPKNSKFNVLESNKSDRKSRRRKSKDRDK